MSKEIERQWVLEKDVMSDVRNDEIFGYLKGLKDKTDRIDIKLVRTVEQYQSYLYVGQQRQVRFRKSIVTDRTGTSIPTHTVTVKDQYHGSDTIPHRNEVSIEITAEQYKELLAMVGGKFINKQQKVYSYQRNSGKTVYIEVNRVDPGTDNSFIFAEIEFNSEEEAAEFEWPFNDGAIEVTGKTEGHVGKSMSMMEYWTTVVESST